MHIKSIFLVVLMFVSCSKVTSPETGEYPYEVLLPVGYSESKLYPTIVYLHGAGDPFSNDPNPIKNYRDSASSFPFILVRMISKNGINIPPWEPDKVVNTLKKIRRQYSVNGKKIYLTGLSMGGFGTMNTSIKYPYVFAAVAPVAGGTHYSSDLCDISHLPVWIFHNTGDEIVTIEYARVVVDHLSKCGNNIKHSFFERNGHDAWTPAYSNKDLYDWFLAHEAPFNL